MAHTSVCLHISLSDCENVWKYVRCLSICTSLLNIFAVAQLLEYSSQKVAEFYNGSVALINILLQSPTPFSENFCSYPTLASELVLIFQAQCTFINPVHIANVSNSFILRWQVCFIEIHIKCSFCQEWENDWLYSINSHNSLTINSEGFLTPFTSDAFPITDHIISSLVLSEVPVCSTNTLCLQQTHQELGEGRVCASLLTLAGLAGWTINWGSLLKTM